MVHYWLAQVHEITDLIEKTRSVVERYGTRAQRASFFQSLYLMNIRRENYVASEETVGYARTSLAASEESEDVTEIAWARAHLGFCHLWHGDLDLAEQQLQAAQVVGVQTGDVTLQLRCLTYLTVISRKRGQVEATRRSGSQALAVATTMQLPEYIALAKANLAWAAWREGNLLEAHMNGLAALELRRQFQVVSPFDWMALYPLIGVELAQNRLAEAIDYAGLLLAPQQQPLPEAQRADIEAAMQARDAGRMEMAHTHLQKAMASAQEMGYL